MKTKNIWKCPECDKEVDYGDSEPSIGRTYCSVTRQDVQMIRVKSPMQELRIYQADVTYLVNCVEVLLKGYEFKFTNVLDATGRYIHHTNASAMKQLERALSDFKSVDNWRKEHDKEQADDV